MENVQKQILKNKYQILDFMQGYFCDFFLLVLPSPLVPFSHNGLRREENNIQRKTNWEFGWLLWQFEYINTDAEFEKCRYVLGQADLAVASFNELSVINLRRLFAHKGSNFMDMQKQIIEKTPPRRKLTIDTIFWFSSHIIHLNTFL